MYFSAEQTPSLTSSHPSNINTLHGTPRDSPAGVRKRAPLNMHQDAPGGSTEAYNQGYKDKSWDTHRDPLPHATPNPTYERGTNPAYSDTSPTQRPKLPYPGSHYDIYPTQGSNHRL